MNLKDELLRKGYFPENLPPPFTSENIAEYFHNRRGRRFRAATYNASKRGMTRRIFSAVHPVTAYELANFISIRWQDISDFFSRSQLSFSIPANEITSHRALTINSHAKLEQEKIHRLSSYRYIACTDIARFYHSIYTHSIPWAFHGKAEAKNDRDSQSSEVFMNKADQIIRNGQDGQTIGIPVGPDMSRVFAEIVGTAIDLQFQERTSNKNYTCLRHVDDIWIGTDSHTDAEQALSQYREAVRYFELDINEYKTGIYSENFSFLDVWPSEILKNLNLRWMCLINEINFI